MTASALAADRERALASGMNAHIAKPIDVEGMFRTLAEWITPSHAAVPPAEWPPSMPPLPPDLAALRHIDARDAIARCTGNEALYRRLLHGFAQAQAGFEAAFAQARANADWARAEHLAHDLKGLAGNLGARAVQAAAAALQQACRDADEQTAAKALASVMTALRPTLQEIASLRDARPAS
jgi:HPt (histidine-containing phosphotransfer) domain-containing protein